LRTPRILLVRHKPGTHRPRPATSVRVSEIVIRGSKSARRVQRTLAEPFSLTARSDFPPELRLALHPVGRGKLAEPAIARCRVDAAGPPDFHLILGAKPNDCPGSSCSSSQSPSCVGPIVVCNGAIARPANRMSESSFATSSGRPAIARSSALSQSEHRGVNQERAKFLTLYGF
jgi:hypothetical protein